LDAYLNEQNSEVLIKDAINIAKPFFFKNVINERLDIEARKVFDAFKAESTGDDILHYYIFSLWYPEARNLNTFKRLTSFNEDRDKLGYLESLFPDRSRRYAMKHYISLMGQDVQATSVDQLEQATKAAYGDLAQMKEHFGAIDKKFDKEVIEREAKLLKKPFNHENEVDNRPELNYYNFDHQEIEEIFDYSDKAEYLSHYLEENQ
jgi:hypothetical protein